MIKMRKIIAILLTVLLSLSCFSLFACDTEDEPQPQPTVYSIIYDVAGGELPADAITTYMLSETDIALPVPTKAEHVFLGWLEKNETEPTTVIAAGSTGNKTFTAVWRSRVVYNISYDTVGGELPAGAITTYMLSETDTTLPVPTKEGYVFGGWLENGTTLVTCIVAGATGDKTFVALWKSRFTVVVNNETDKDFTDWADDSTGSKTVYVSVGEKLTIPKMKWDNLSEDQKHDERYGFQGWFYIDKNNVERQLDLNVEITLENLNINAYNVTIYAKVLRQWTKRY